MVARITAQMKKATKNKASVAATSLAFSRTHCLSSRQPVYASAQKGARHPPSRAKNPPLTPRHFAATPSETNSQYNIPRHMPSGRDNVSRVG